MFVLKLRQSSDEMYFMTALTLQETLNISTCADSSTDTKSKIKLFVSSVACQVTIVRCHMSVVLCHMLHVTCHLSQVTNANSHSHGPSLC